MSLVNGIHCVGQLTQEDIIYAINCDLYKQIMIHTTFKIPEQKPDIESVINVNLQSKIIRSSIIRSIEGFKIIFHGVVEGTVAYVAKVPEQPVHSAHFYEKFHSFIKCMKIYDCEHDCDCNCHHTKYDDKKTEYIVEDDYIIKAYIEYIEPELINEREVDITMIVLVNIRAI